MNYYCTYLDSNYLAKGMVAIESLMKNTGENVKIYVICMDELTRLILNKTYKNNLTLNSTAKPGDMLILTKPLGTGIISTAIKKSGANSSIIKESVDVMTHLNLGAAKASP